MKVPMMHLPIIFFCPQGLFLEDMYKDITHITLTLLGLFVQ